MDETILKVLRRSRWVHSIQTLVFISWLINPFPGALSYWGMVGDVKTQLTDPPEGDEWYQKDDDNDGLTNAQEVLFGSDPGSIDSDHDGLPDLAEYQVSFAAFSAGSPLPFDPWSWDTNGNGFSDHDEFYQQIQGYQPVVNYLQLPAGTTWPAGTYFSYSDADGDGLKNFEDSDPLNMDRDGDTILNWKEASGQMDDPNNGVTPPPDDPGVIIGGTWYPTGTLDSDGDGTPNHLDPFPYGSFVYQGIEYGGSSVDSDNDGIPDPADPFPNGSYWYLGVEYAGTLVDQDGDGIPDSFDPWPAIAGSFEYQGVTYPGSMSDQDGDGIPDSLDQWPSIAGSYVYNGTVYPGSMSDMDNDGIPDAFDTIFSGPGNSYWWDGIEYVGTPVDQDADGIPDPFDPYPTIAGSYYYHDVQYPGSWVDGDNDGVPDPADTFPNVAYSFWYNGAEYPGPWYDSDADGIPDSLDTAPGDPWNDSPHYTYQETEYAGIWSDRDQDGIPDPADAYPDDPSNRVDTDDDGLTDYDENTQYGTDPAKKDTDNDGLSDFAELFTYHTSPLQEKTNSNQLYSDYYVVDQTDSDGDGIPDRIEQWYASLGYGMNPSVPTDAMGDLDSDGYTNLQAYRNHWNLTANTGTYDIDKDGIFDVLEDAWNANYPGILSSSNAKDAAEDHDGDGIMNFEEIALGLDPGSQFSRSPNVNDALEWAWRGLVLGNEFGLSHHGLAYSGTLPPEWSVMADADGDSVPDGLKAFVTAFNAAPTPSPFILPSRAASGDYDGDGIPDFWEHLNRLDARDAADAQDNPDNDSLTNLQEYNCSRNPWINDDPTLQFATNTLPLGTVGAAYSTSIQVSGGTAPYSFSRTGPLPAGLTFGSSGSITGTPTADGVSTFTVQVTDSSNRSTMRGYNLFILSSDQPLAITTTNAQMNAITGVPFTVTLAASGGASDGYTFVIGGVNTLPSGLAISADNKTISGTPTEVGSFSFTATVNDGTGSATKDFLLTVSDPLAFITASDLPGGQVGTEYSQQIEVTGGWSQKLFSVVLGPLPPDVVLTPSGRLLGTPSASGIYAFTLRATDAVGHVKDQAFRLVISPRPQSLAITTTSLPVAGKGIAYSAVITASGGSGGYVFSGGGGTLTVNPDGTITGVPGQSDITVNATVTDSAQGSATATFEVPVASPVLSVTGGNQQIVVVGDTPQPVTVMLTAGGIGLAGVTLSMGSQSTTTEADGSAGFLLAAPEAEGEQIYTVSTTGGISATVSIYGYQLPDGSNNTISEIVPDAPPKPELRQLSDADVKFQSHSLSLSTGTLMAHYCPGRAIGYVNGHPQVWYEEGRPDYSLTQTKWSASDGSTGTGGSMPMLASLPWVEGVIDGFDQKYVPTDYGQVGPPANDSGVSMNGRPPWTYSSGVHLINGQWMGKVVNRETKTTSEYFVSRKTIEEGGTGAMAAISIPIMNVVYATEADGVEKLLNCSVANKDLAANQNATDPIKKEPDALEGQKIVDGVRRDILIDVNDTVETKDDIVRKEQKIGVKAWRQWIPCTVKIADPSGSEATSIVASSQGNTMKFALTILQPPDDATEGSYSLTVPLDSQGSGSFWITGVEQSNNVNDRIIEIRKNTASGIVIGTKPMTVFWFNTSIDINTDNVVTEDFVDRIDHDRRYGLDQFKEPVRFELISQVVPTQVDCSVPQIRDWQFGMVQNVQVTASWVKSPPSLEFSWDKPADDDRLIVPSKVTIIKRQPSFFLDADNADQVLVKGLEGLNDRGGNSSFHPRQGMDDGKAHYYAVDSPSIPFEKSFDKPIEFPTLNDPNKNYKVNYFGTEWRYFQFNFVVWGGLVEVKPPNGQEVPTPTPGIFIPLRQRNWIYSADSRLHTPQPPQAEPNDKIPNIIPVVGAPIGNDNSTYINSVDPYLPGDEEGVLLISPK
ncbi:putative Ig domain-containing protein [Prosthecobacter sp.]|uniref:putative Ig domain-containing protein n=1 Tax=Prosthecobacter sp. TaxID=1965333 RepID=UPI00378462E3